jgi:hypothetical protein
MSMDYEAIKALAKERGVSVSNLIAMSTNHDPFYMGKPADRVAAEWFGDVWQRFGFTSGVHLRRIHYRLVSQAEPIRLWFDDKPYENTVNCWTNLMEAAGQARYLKVVDFDAFVDQRNPNPALYQSYPPFFPPEVAYLDDEAYPLSLSVLRSALWTPPRLVLQRHLVADRLP